MPPKVIATMPPSTPNSSRVSKSSSQSKTPSRIQQKLRDLPANKFVELMGLIDDPKVTIYVGPQRKGYLLSKKLLCCVSAYFSAAFDGSFKEGATQTLTMEEDDVDAFELMVQFMYLNRIVLPQEDNPTDRITKYLSLVKLADKIGMLEVVKIAYVELKALLNTESHSSLLQRSHFDMVYGSDWPVSVAGVDFRKLLCHDISAVFRIRAVAKSPHEEWHLTEALAEVPGLANDVLMETKLGLGKASEKFGARELSGAMLPGAWPVSNLEPDDISDDI